MKRIALIHSRQPLRPNGASSWVSATRRAIDVLKRESGVCFLCSLGNSAHELTLAALGRAGVKIEVILHKEQALQYGASQAEIECYVASQYDIHFAGLRLQILEKDSDTTHSALHARDLSILDHADVIYPISIRPGGFMEEKIDELGADSRRVNREYQVPYVAQSTSIARDYSSRRVNSEAAGQLSNHVIHWTRASGSPWPGETCAEFYTDIMNSGNDYARSAKRTLCRILQEKLIRGSARHSSDNEKFVAFTSAGAAQSANMMRYRARYCEMTCEPFGIAIPQVEISRLGIQKVTYLPADQVRKLPSNKRRFVHAEGVSGHWKSEHEWRASGDVELTGLESEITVVVECESDREQFEHEIGCETIALFAD